MLKNVLIVAPFAASVLDIWSITVDAIRRTGVCMDADPFRHGYGFIVLAGFRDRHLSVVVP